jgi:hypothetical protein
MTWHHQYQNWHSMTAEGTVGAPSCLFCMLWLHDTIVSPREYYLVASVRSSPVDCCGCAVVLHVGGSSCCLVAAILCCAMQIFAEDRWRRANRQSMMSVGEVTAEEGRYKFLCTQPELNRWPLAYAKRMVPQDHCQCTWTSEVKDCILQWQHHHVWKQGFWAKYFCMV